jgi:hypothetical protein
MSALPPKADIGTRSRDVRFVPKADINPSSIRSTSAAASSPYGTVRPSALAVIAAKCNGGFLNPRCLPIHNFFRNNLSHGILAVAQTKEAFASNLKRWMDLR